MTELKVLLSRLGQSDQIKGYLNKINDSLALIKRCVVILVFLAGLTVFLSEWLQTKKLPKKSQPLYNTLVNLRHPHSRVYISVSAFIFFWLTIQVTIRACLTASDAQGKLGCRLYLKCHWCLQGVYPTRWQHHFSYFISNQSQQSPRLACGWLYGFYRNYKPLAVANHRRHRQ